jgi:hypothetical protein
MRKGYIQTLFPPKKWWGKVEVKYERVEILGRQTNSLTYRGVDYLVKKKDGKIISVSSFNLYEDIK